MDVGNGWDIEVGEMDGQYYATITRDGEIVYTTEASGVEDAETAKRIAIDWINRNYPV